MLEDRCWLCPASPETSEPEVALKGLFSVNYCVYLALEGLYTEPACAQRWPGHSLLQEGLAGAALGALRP